MLSRVQGTKSTSLQIMQEVTIFKGLSIFFVDAKLAYSEINNLINLIIPCFNKLLAWYSPFIA